MLNPFIIVIQFESMFMGSFGLSPWKQTHIIRVEAVVLLVSVDWVYYGFIWVL